MSAVPTSSAIAVAGSHLVVHDWGGSGSPALLAHPTGFHGLAWAEIATRLVARGRHVWSFDFRGHGDSDAIEHGVTDGYAWTGFADDVLAVTDHLGVDGDPSLLACGHSKGGTALLLGEADRPGTFARIWAYEPIVFPDNERSTPHDNFPMARAARKRRNVWNSRDEAFAAYASKPPLDVITHESLRAYVDYGLRERGDGTLELKCRPEIEARVYAMGPSSGGFARLGDIDARVLIAVGEMSTSIDPALGARIAGRLARGRLVVLPGLGHFGPQEDPDACAASMLRFAAES